jgi:hypothetical protein
VLLALGLARWRGRGSGAANGLMLVPLVTPEIVMAVSLLLVFTQLAIVPFTLVHLGYHRPGGGRVAVMNAGRIEQIGTPAAVYEDPTSVFVADFLGVSNLLQGECIAGGAGECTVQIGETRLRARAATRARRGPSAWSLGPSAWSCLSTEAIARNAWPGWSSARSTSARPCT